MVEANGANHGDVRIDDVGGIQPSAQAHLEHGHIDHGAVKQVERRQRVVFEKRERDVAANRIDALERFDEARIAGFHAVDADAFVVAREVRRGEAATAQAGGTQQRVNTGDRRTLAIGAAYGDHAEVWRQQIETACHFAHAAQGQIDGLRVGLLLLLEPVGERAHAPNS